MPTEIKIPELGDNVESGDVLEILVSVGDSIEKEQGIIELETDKATVIVPSPTAGKISEIKCSEGDTVKVGSIVMMIDAASGAEEKPKEPESKQPESKQPESKQPESKQPESKQPESKQPKPEPVDPPRAAEPPQKPAPPVAPQKPVAPQPPVTPVAAVASQPTIATMESETDLSHVAAGPAIRRFAREVGVDLSMITGSGENGRIVREDVLKVVRAGNKPVTGTKGNANGGQNDGHGPVHIEKMPKIRQTIARKMHESWTTCPRVTNFDDADVTALDDIRKNSKAEYAAKGIKLTTMPFLIKAIAMSLKSHPVVNASVDLEAGQIIYKDYVNIGVAVDTDRGLVVPVLRDADKMSIPDTARQLGELAENVRNNNFSIEQLRGGSFSISNLGAIGGTYSTPIINTPETAILLVGRSRKLPVVMPDDQIAVRLMMPLSLSYDHRLIDGGAAARFLNEVIGYLEAPSRLLLAL